MNLHENLPYEQHFDLSLNGSQNINEMGRRLNVMANLYVAHISGSEIDIFSANHRLPDGSARYHFPPHAFPAVVPGDGTFTCVWDVEMRPKFGRRLAVRCSTFKDNHLVSLDLVKSQDPKDGNGPGIPGQYVRMVYDSRGTFVRCMLELFPELEQNMRYLTQAGLIKL
jgi:hypothetical protein